jgi:hypothetical protein
MQRHALVLSRQLVDKEYYTKTPENLTDDQLLSIAPAGHNKVDWVDNCRFIIHCILKQSSIGKTHKRTSLDSKLLKKVHGNKYPIYINALIDAGIIIKGDSYSSKLHFALEYQVEKKYQKSKQQIRQITSQSLRRRLYKLDRDKIRESGGLGQESSHLTRWLNSGKLRIDEEAAKAFIMGEFKECLHSSLAHFELTNTNIYTSIDQVEDAIVNQLKAKIELFNKSTAIHRKLKNRLYSKLTTSPTILRNFISFNGETLMSVDLKNSQPYLLILALTPRFWRNVKDDINLDQLYPNLIEDPKLRLQVEDIIHNLQRHTIVFPNFMDKSDYQLDDVALYSKLVVNGKLYKFILELIKSNKFKNNDLCNIENESQAKSAFIEMMYSNPKIHFSKSSELFRVFKKRFPTVAKVMNLLKAQHHKEFPIVLQKIEAIIVLDQITRSYSIESPRAPMFTIHDSIVSTKDHIEALTNLSIFELYGKTKAIPKLTLESYNIENARQKMKKYIMSKLDQRKFLKRISTVATSEITKESPMLFDELPVCSACDYIQGIAYSWNMFSKLPYQPTPSFPLMTMLTKGTSLHPPQQIK